MYIISQATANQIAATQMMASTKMKALFEATEEQAEQMEAAWRETVSKKAGDQVARAMIAFSPLLLETVAITNYINQTKDYSLRGELPELLTAEETALMAQQEYFLTENETMELIQLLKGEQSTSHNV